MFTFRFYPDGVASGRILGPISRYLGGNHVGCDEGREDERK